MIQGWMASKIWGIVIFCVACLSVVLLPVAIVQSVRLNGFSLLGWEITEGYKPMAERLGRENGTLIRNNLVISNGLDKCNLGVTELKTARLAFQNEAQKLVDERLRLQKEFNTRISRVNALRPTDAKCPTIDTIFSTGFGK